ncbi:MAG: thrombospondin type 3 repeat-containing protein [Candidatus Yanofskybacteria bacterium]|nr:thrombospondin type 3 repeat-containing protein [Candidatus Yanofskybacteria bacterium]
MLALAAVISIYQLTDTLRAKAINRLSLNPSLQQGNISETYDSDFDNDGLTNGEESFWNTDFQNPDTDGDGFLDGEEVASGHDPTIPGPNDKLDNSVAGNVTKKISELVLGGIYEGSLRPDSPNFDRSIDELTNEILFRTELNAPAISPNNLRLLENTNENEKQYKQAIIPLIRKIGAESPSGLNRLVQAASQNSKNPNAFSQFLVNELGIIKKHIQEWEAIPVPKKWANHHEKVLNVLKNVERNYLLLQVSKEDPLQTLAAFSNLTQLLLEDILDALKNYEPIFSQ